MSKRMEHELVETAEPKLKEEKRVFYKIVSLIV